MAPFHPVQPRDVRELPAAVTARAYDVYYHLYPGQTLERINERGGLGVIEVIAFLYAHSFPREEWNRRAQEVFIRRQTPNTTEK